MPIISSKCTLIVTPSIISQQWIDEIKKHVKIDLKVLFYAGCYRKYIQPQDLANYDICITTYDVLNDELSHIFAMENMRQLRKPKRFMSIPCPLTCVEWWRICLDEAQMVHSTNSRCAEMANRLKAINRWCITGTPIGKSLADLHGLFSFIRDDPFYEKKWFNEILLKPFTENNRLPMARAVSKVLWRTAKKFVEDQINIPKQSEIVYKFNFSPFEKHLYERLIEDFRNERKNNFAQSNPRHHRDFNNESIQTIFAKLKPDQTIDEIDRTLLDQILAPLIDLRQACNHPQLVLKKKNFLAAAGKFRKEKLLTIEQSHQIVVKKTLQECENVLRAMTMNSCAIAGLHLLRNEFNNAIAEYKNIMRFESDFNKELKLDLLQKLHVYNNYIYALKHNNQSIDNNIETNKEINEYSKLLQETESIYTLAYDETRAKEEEKLKKTMKHTHDDIVKVIDPFCIF